MLTEAQVADSYLNPKTNPYGLPWGLIWGTAANPGQPYPGVSSLINILQNAGATDPRLLAQTAGQINQGTSAAQGQAGQLAAMQGQAMTPFQMALQKALGEGGQQRLAQMYAQNAQTEDARKRTDLMNLLGGLIQGGKIQYRGLLGGVQANQAALQAQQNQAYAAAGAGLLGTAGSLIRQGQSQPPPAYSASAAGSPASAPYWSV